MTTDQQPLTDEELTAIEAELWAANASRFTTLGSKWADTRGHCLLAEVRRLRSGVQSLIVEVNQRTRDFETIMLLAKQLPFCGHRDCAAGQHPASNCTGCEVLWAAWTKTLQAFFLPPSIATAQPAAEQIARYTQ